jgi:hypothetical protein
MADAADIDYILKDTPNANEFALVSYVKASLIKLKPADFPTENTTLYKDFPHRVASAVEKYGNYLYREQDISRTGNGFVGFLFTKPTGSGTSKTRIKHIRKQADGTLRKIITNEVDGNTLPSAVTGKEITQEQVDATHSVVESDEIVSGGTRTDYEFHPITKSLITTTREVLTQATPSQSVGQKVTQQQLRDNWAERITKAVDTSALDAYFEGSPVYINNLPLPNAVLQSISVTWATAHQNGGFSTTWTGTASGTAYSLSGNEQGSAEASGSLIPSLIPIYKRYRTKRYRGIAYRFFIQRPFTYAQLLSKINTGHGITVSEWPTFVESQPLFTLVGGKTAIQARASGSAGLSYSPSGTSKDLTEGQGDSYDKSLTMQQIELEPCIYDAITLTGDATKSQALSVTAAAVWTGTGSPVFPSSTATKTAEDTVDGSVTPTSLSATTPSSVPSSGKYLVSFEEELMPDIGYSMIIANIIDASVIP